LLDGDDGAIRFMLLDDQITVPAFNGCVG